MNTLAAPLCQRYGITEALPAYALTSRAFTHVTLHYQFKLAYDACSLSDTEAFPVGF